MTKKSYSAGSFFLFFGQAHLVTIKVSPVKQNFDFMKHFYGPLGLVRDINLYARHWGTGIHPPHLNM